MELRISRVHGLALYNNLYAVSDENGHHVQHQMRHPADILRQQFDQLVASQRLFKQSITKNGFDESKGREINGYILALDSFFDNMLLIVKSVLAPNDSPNKDASKWLKAAKSDAYFGLLDSTTKTHGFIRKLANKIKHDAVEINYIEIEDYEGSTVDGFYFSNIVNNQGLSGPDTELYERYRGSSTATSYNYFMLYSTGFIASCVFNLNKLIFNKQMAEGQNVDNIYSFFSEASNVEPRFFPNEYGLDIVEISEHKDTMIAKFPRRVKAKKEYDNIRGISPQFKMNQRTNSSSAEFPYFNLLNRQNKP